jgi:hypothetical protein
MTSNPCTTHNPTLAFLARNSPPAYWSNSWSEIDAERRLAFPAHEHVMLMSPHLALASELHGPASSFKSPRHGVATMRRRINMTEIVQRMIRSIHRLGAISASMASEWHR